MTSDDCLQEDFTQVRFPLDAKTRDTTMPTAELLPRLIDLDTVSRAAEEGRGRGILFYDEGCAFCRSCVAKTLAWDRDLLIVPLAISSPEAQMLLAGIEPDRRRASWHFLDPRGTLFSAGPAFAPLLRLLPGGSPLAAVASRFPGGVERAYRLVARNRRGLGALLSKGARARADQRLARSDYRTQS